MPQRPFTFSCRLLALGAALVLVTVGAAAQAQTASSPAATGVTTPPAAAAAPNIAWGSLTPQQQTALAPLQASWLTLADGNRRRWIALAQNFSTMSTGDRDKLQARMAEWAALKPNERQQARLNFAETKKTPPAEREANWEVYQALSAEEKAALAGKAPAKPAGAAIAAKAPTPQKLTVVPLTRNSPDAQREKVTTQQPVNRNTLLPLPPVARLAPATPASALTPPAESN
jgi:hypothetical protein